jgi:N-acetyl-anhydromuramyl-L-alanine amidase AmpD
VKTPDDPRANPPPLPTAAPIIVAVAGPLAIRDQIAHASNYSAHTRPSTQALVIHCTDGCEGSGHKDRDVAAMFQDPNLVDHRSAHYVVDADSCTRCVPDAQIAWHARHHGNAATIGIELCGRASQTREQWLDQASLATLQIAARLCADLCAKYRLPPAAVTAVGLVSGARGITTHAYVSEAWKQSTHYDPGPGFPFVAFVAAVGRAMPVGS